MQWITRHVKDTYVQRSHQDGYRSRSAYKLKQMDTEYKFLKDKCIVVDLGCNAGGWAQVALQRTGVSNMSKSAGMVIGVDKVHMEPLDQHHFIHGDITELATLRKVEALLTGRRAHVVLSDLAPHMIGIPGDDHLASVDLCRAAAKFAEAVLQDGGWFITKIFDGVSAMQHRAELQARYGKVRVVKPKASRSSSRELYFVCSKFLGSQPAVPKRPPDD